MKGTRDIVILVLFAAVAGGALSGVYSVTKGKIAAAAERERTEALKAVLPTLSAQAKLVVIQHEGRALQAVIDGDGGAFKGAVLELETRKGYAGLIRFLVGVDGDLKVTGLYILQQSETPGLGTKAKDKAWWGQFLGKGQDGFRFKVKKDGGDVESITAATITSRAITDQVDFGLRALAAHLGKR